MTQINMPIRAAPYAHQRAAYDFVLDLFIEEKSPGAALLMEMGTGKTLTTISIVGTLSLAHRIQRVLIVAPLRGWTFFSRSRTSTRSVPRANFS